MFKKTALFSHVGFPNYANVLFVLKVFNLSLRCEKKGPQYIDFPSSGICCIYWCMPLVCAWLVGLANTERGGQIKVEKFYALWTLS